MASNAGLIVGWNQPIANREAETTAKFTEYLGYLGKLKNNGQIESFEPVLAQPHGGDLNGFILVRGEKAKFAQLRDTDEWKNWEAWGAFNLMGFGVVPCYLGDAIQDQMTRYSKFIKR